MNEELSNRMKNNYEHRNRYKLIRRMPVVMRIDGRNFHTLTKDCDKPFDNKFIKCMEDVGNLLLHEIQGAKAVYVQSDEISILLTDYDKLETDAWFDYNIQKIVSISAGIASVEFTKLFGKEGIFDSRAFNIPKEEVSNYFIWRYNDWLRNSLHMFANSFYSQKELNGKKKEDMHEMLFKKGQNWSKLSEQLKNGTLITKEKVYFPKNIEELRKIIEVELK